jgi:hypothetical protein
MDKLHQQQLLEFLESSSKSLISKKPLTDWWEVFYCPLVVSVVTDSSAAIASTYARTPAGTK